MGATPTTTRPVEIDATASQARGGAISADELKQVIEAYNEVTERLERSHNTLTAEVQRLHDELASANAALQRSRRLAALGEMAAGIAHEVRNPLASIQLYAQMLVEDLADQPVQQDIATKISAAVRGLDAIVGDVLTFARDIKPRAVEGALSDLIERALHTLEALTRRRGTHLDVRVEGEPVFEHDPDLMHQALVNIMRNGVQAMDEGGALAVEAAQRGSTVQIAIADTGPGIDDEAIERIFNPFFTTRATGTGLGLPIVHRIIDAHGGTIAVSNHPETGGAVFTITIPVRQASTDDAAAANAAGD